MFGTWWLGYVCVCVCVGLAYQGKDIVFGFIIEYSSLRDFYRPLGNNIRSIFIWGFFLKDDISTCVETWDQLQKLRYLEGFWFL